MSKNKLTITGFGPFSSIAENPSSILGEKIVGDLISSYPNLSFVSLETSVSACEKFYSERDDNSETIIHIGVNQGASTIEIEQFAYNKANFSIPDVEGTRLTKAKIDPDMEFGASLSTKFNAKDLAEKINAMASEDPGDYICNYIYFKALKNVKEGKSKNALFVHVPDFKTKPKSTQVELLTNLIELVLKTE